MVHRKPFRPFRDMVYLGIPDSSCESEQLALDDLIPGRGTPRLFLGCYGEDEIREALAKYGIHQKLVEQGLGDYRIYINATDPDRQEVRIFPVLKQPVESLGHQPSSDSSVHSDAMGELIVREALLSPGEVFWSRIRPFSFLVIQWMRLQNPLKPSDPDRLLPGQHHPGLGIGHNLMQMLRVLAEKRNLDGIVNRPEFLHNALLYSPYFRYLNPAAEGRLQALKRDIAGRTLWEVGWGASKGLLMENGKPCVQPWYQAEQLWSNNSELAHYLQSDSYRNEVERARNDSKFELPAIS